MGQEGPRGLIRHLKHFALSDGKEVTFIVEDLEHIEARRILKTTHNITGNNYC